jgi:serine/threonine-protein kinase
MGEDFLFGGHSMIGELIKDRYRIVRQIATGKQGVVFLAYDELLFKRKRAIKQIIYNKNSTSIEVRHEVNVLASLYNSSIPTVIDYFNDENSNCLFLVMDWIEGTRLDDVVSKINRVDRIELFRVGMKQLLNLFNQLHNHPTTSFIYCDLKPDNILIEPNLNYKLIDFGISVSLNQEHRQIIGIGNVHFSAPELYVQGKVNPSNDLYSLGCVLFYILSEGQFVTEKNLNKLNWTIGISTLEVSIILKLVERKVNDRYQRISDVIGDYKKWLFSIGQSDILGTIS